jgi:heterotetrameric sarcosine oxidase gamma subunit
MTGISPLQSIHKKGLFGDHYKKKENDLLNISEVKNLIIVQLVQYKKSKIQCNSVNIDGLALPLQASKVLANKDTRVMWSAPNTWLVTSKNEDIIKIIEKQCNSENFAITDISHSRAIIQITGTQAKEVLKKGCPINFNEFKKDNCAGSVFHGINIVIDCIDGDLQKFNLLTLRSFGESLYHHITDSSLEFGFVGI